MLKDTKCCPGGLCYALVGANECASFDVTNILQLVPPFLQTYCTNAANIPRERRHEWWIVEEDIWYYLAPLVSESESARLQLRARLWSRATNRVYWMCNKSDINSIIYLRVMRI